MLPHTHLAAPGLEPTADIVGESREVSLTHPGDSETKC
nr:hypothetical protein JVH1_0054 [Rhodococcus sp. JVH1]